MAWGDQRALDIMSANFMVDFQYMFAAAQPKNYTGAEVGDNVLMC